MGQVQIIKLKSETKLMNDGFGSNYRTICDQENNQYMIYHSFQYHKLQVTYEIIKNNDSE